MSGFTPIALSNFRKLLRARGTHLGEIAEQIGTTRSYLSRVLWGHLESSDTRKRLFAVTTAQEWATLCHVENWATWNSAQNAAEAAAKPGEYHWLMRQECMICRGDRRFVPSCRSQARDITHGICPDCVRKHFNAVDADEILSRAAKKAAAESLQPCPA